MSYSIVPKASFAQFLNLDVNYSFGECLKVPLFLQIKKDKYYRYCTKLKFLIKDFFSKCD